LQIFAEPVGQLTNPDFEAPYLPISGTNAYGYVAGSFPHGWTDNSRYSGRHTVNLYAQETASTLSGSALRATASVQDGFTSGANIELYQRMYAVSGRLYEAGIWFKSLSNVTVNVALRKADTPYTTRISAAVAIGQDWSRAALALTSTVSETLAFEVKCPYPTTLWIDDSSCAVVDGHRSWYVDPGGSDRNPGTIDAPFRTLAYAATNLNAGDILLLRAGIYRETFQPPQSGVPDAPVTVAAYAGEPVTISGCDTLDAAWYPVNNSIYAASVGWTLGSGYDQLFADSEMKHEARHPNHGPGGLLDPATAALTVSSNYTVACSGFAGLGDLTGARLYAGVGSCWSWQTAIVASNSAETLYLQPNSVSSWWWPNYGNKATDSGRGFLYGHPRLLDADGEWLLQTNAAPPHTLFLRLSSGADPSSCLVEFKRRPWCLDLNGRNYYTISNLAFRAGAVRLNGTGLLLAGCDIRHPSHFLVFASGGSTNGDRTEGGGVVVSGTSNTVASCTVAETAGSGILASGTGHRLTRNRIFQTDYSGTYAACMVLSGTGHTADFNTLHDTGRDILRPTGRGLRVLFNDLHSAGRLCKDLGAIYAWGTDGLAPDGTINRLAYNWVHDSTPADPLGMGIYIDNYSRNFQIDHNVVWNFGIRETQTWSDGLRLNAPAENLRLFHNTAFRCNNYDRGTFTGYQPGVSTPDNNYWCTTNHHLRYTAFNNLYMTNSAHELVDADNWDFRPKSGSYAIDPPFATNAIAWFTTNGVDNVPPGYRLSMRFKSQYFGFEDLRGLGVPLDADGDGEDEPFVGASPDSGAYERDAPYWVPGADGWLPQCPGIRSEQPLAYVGDTVTAKGTLVSTGSAPSDLFLFWGSGDSSDAWTNSVCLGTGLDGVFQPLLCNFSGVTLHTTYGYRFLITNAYGATWSAPVTFTTGSGLPQSATWDGGGGADTAFQTAANWAGDAAPDLNGAALARFGTGGGVATLASPACLYGASFDRDAAFALGGETLTVRSGGLAAAAPSAAARTYTVSTPLLLACSQVWCVTNSGGATTLNVTGPITDTLPPCGIAKTGNGALLLAAANAYRGETTVSNGTLAITHAAALGATNRGTVVRANLGGCLQISGGLAVAEPLTINGERPNSGYSLQSSSGSNVWSGPLTRIGQTRINVSAGSTFVLAGGATGSGSLFVVNATGTFILSDKPLLIGTAGFWADSAGLTVLSVASNVWGETTLGRGTLRTDVPNALPPATRFRFGLNYAAGGTFDLNGCDQTVGQLLHNTATAAVRTVTSPVPATLTVNQSADTTFDGRFTGSVRLLKLGAGSLTLSATNTTANGGVTVSNGTLAASAPAALGSGPVSLCGGTLRNAVPNRDPLQIASLAWDAAGVFALSLRDDGNLCGAEVAGNLSRGRGAAFVFDFGGSGEPGRTYALLAFGTTDFTASDFNCRNLGVSAKPGLQGRFFIAGDTLYLKTSYPSATVLVVR